MRIIIALITLMIFVGCSGTEHDEIKTKKYFNITDTAAENYLISFSQDSIFTPGSSYGYKNLNGDTIIPIGKYQYCFTDTFKTFAIVADEKLTNSEMAAIERNEKIVFDVYMFDNGPDWLEEGLFRIKRNGKIGYADKNGIIIIEPQFECAGQFEDGTARVSLNCNLVKSENGTEHTSMESSSWFYIDKKGNRIK